MASAEPCTSAFTRIGSSLTVSSALALAISCSSVVAAPTAVPRDRLRPRGIAAATGTRDGAPVVVVCSVGVDVEAPIQAADTRAMLDQSATLLLATPARDVLPVTRTLVDELRDAEIVPIEIDGRR